MLLNCDWCLTNAGPLYACDTIGCQSVFCADDAGQLNDPNDLCPGCNTRAQREAREYLKGLAHQTRRDGPGRA